MDELKQSMKLRCEEEGHTWIFDWEHPTDTNGDEWEICKWCGESILT